jgi:hypothetical protein
MNGTDQTIKNKSFLLLTKHINPVASTMLCSFLLNMQLTTRNGCLPIFSTACGMRYGERTERYYS